MSSEASKDGQETRLTYEVPEAGALLGLSKSASYAAAERGELGEVIKIGRRKMLLKAAFHRKFNLPAA